jgi:ABC-type xylose transport system permease subunit
MIEWLAGLSSPVDAAPATLFASAVALAAVVYGPRRRRRRRHRTSPDFRNAVAIVGVMWVACVVVLGVLLLLKR